MKIHINEKMRHLPKKGVANGYDLDELNKEFVKLIEKHNAEGDIDVLGASREDFLSFGDGEGEIGLRQFHASICNAWDELCERHEGLSESGLQWSAGVNWTSFPDNAYDVYVGVGDPDIDWIKQ